ncbi:hypothetical protein GJAV_G00264110 [Gymnothorax javanicus]|nr:hypothetical protein GJAV_G00264110 [Gymnothorax javanicus]
MPPLEKPQHTKPFKLRKSFATRKQEVAGIRTKFPTKIPVIIERYSKEKFLPPLDKTKFLVPQELSMTQFVTIIRNRMSLMPSQAFYLLINNNGLASMSLTMAQTYLLNELGSCLPKLLVSCFEVVALQPIGQNKISIALF